MRGNPVEDDADPGAVELVDKIHEVLGRTHAGGHGEISRHLIAPGAFEREFGHGHEFHVRIPHLLDVRNEFPRQVEIGIIVAVFMAFPREQIDLVDVHRRGKNIFIADIFKICGVTPFVAVQIVQFRGGRRWRFGMEPHGIRLHELPAVRCGNTVFVGIVLLESRNKKLERLSVDHTLHDVCIHIPLIEITHDRNAPRMRCPDAENISLFLPADFLMSAENFVDTVVFPVVVKIEREIRHAPRSLFCRVLLHCVSFGNNFPLTHFEIQRDIAVHRLYYTIFCARFQYPICIFCPFFEKNLRKDTQYPKKSPSDRSEGV